jgi:hypothetical protein
VSQPLERERRPAATDHFQLLIYLDEVEPRIWRRVLVRRQTTLHELHRIIQLLFDWYDYHLYLFEIGGEQYEAPDEEAEGHDSTKARLDRLGLQPGDRVAYVYDWGDDWRHVIEIEEPQHHPDADWLPLVMGGARRGPPEDCGGRGAYAELVRALAQPYEDLEDEERATVDWAGEDFDPEEFSLAQARHSLMLASAWGTLRRKR